MLSIEDFSPISLESQEHFKAHYQKYPPIHSDYVFSTMLGWSEYAHYEYTIRDNALFIKTKVDGIVQFRPPIGFYDKNTYDQFFKLVKEEGSEYPISLITENVKEWINTNYKDTSFTAQPEYSDYVYLTKDLAYLNGSDFRKIRNRLNKFIKNYEYETVPISDDIISEVKHFLKRWCIWRDCEGDPLLDYERKAIMYSIDKYTELGLSGIAVRVNNRIEALSIFEQMNHDTVVVHFEKGSPDYDGIYKFINKEVANIVEKKFTYINRESDMGNPGLRKAKKSYRPDHMINVYKIDKKSI